MTGESGFDETSSSAFDGSSGFSESAASLGSWDFLSSFRIVSALCFCLLVLATFRVSSTSLCSS